jgi:hypothetical protein
MNDYGKLANTGAGAVSVFGATAGQLWLVVIALGLVAVGAVAVRSSWRRNKPAGQA